VFEVTHGACGTPEYRAWASAKERCACETHTSWANYGGRGIRMCAEWLTDFPAFLAEVGQRPTPQHSLGRIDNDGHYEPGNVRWETERQQRRNKRNNLMLTHNGVTRTAIEWAELTGLNALTLRGRIYRGWSHAKALTTPPDPRWQR
jgi:hypothetical protein